jgi:hypothetical protein
MEFLSGGAEKLSLCRRPRREFAAHRAGGPLLDSRRALARFRHYILDRS